MSLNDSDHLEFRGKTIKECEEFIAAVNKHACSQGKLRDDQWIADFVAVCLVGDALIWWSLLDEETQGSWRLLRQAMISRFRPLFFGKSGAEAEEFVQEIRQRALNLGKSNDPRWTAEFASNCFMGTALRWYTLLDTSVQDNWNLLQRAIFAQYSHEFKEDCTTDIAPTPASAAAPPMSNVPVKRRYRGRIRVCKKGDPAIYYVSKIPGYKGRLEETSTIANALEVEHELVPTSEALQALTIPDNQIPGFNQLGMKWYHQAHIYAVFCAVNSESGVTSITSLYEGPVLATPWKVSAPANDHGAKSVIAVGESGKHLLSFGYANNSSYVWFRPESSNEFPVELLFESI